MQSSMNKSLQKQNYEVSKEKEDIVTYLMENVYKQNKIDFYSKYLSLTQPLSREIWRTNLSSIHRSLDEPWKETFCGFLAKKEHFHSHCCVCQNLA